VCVTNFHSVILLTFIFIIYFFEGFHHNNVYWLALYCTARYRRNRCLVELSQPFLRCTGIPRCLSRLSVYVYVEMSVEKSV